MDRPRLPAVVIPVHNAADDLARCLDSVRDTVPPEAAVIVIDDASTDPAVFDVLRSCRQRTGANWTFEANGRNLGFVATVNRGIGMTSGDVVLLNSDTEVTTGWLQGLHRCLESDSAIATATPWTNNGEIASLPRLCEANPVPPDRERVASCIAAAGPPVYPELPTAVGFCMAIARRAIDRIGRFDETRFGRGYGEENDFSMRAVEAGLRNVLCDDVYVVHKGGRSFGPLGLKPGEDSMRRLLEKHPGYLAAVEAFIAADPLADRRRAIIDALERAAVPLS
jgi:GT2 family glycosyltransferase